MIWRKGWIQPILQIILVIGESLLYDLKNIEIQDHKYIIFGSYLLKHTVLVHCTVLLKLRFWDSGSSSWTVIPLFKFWNSWSSVPYPLEPTTECIKDNYLYVTFRCRPGSNRILLTFWMKKSRKGRFSVTFGKLIHSHEK